MDRVGSVERASKGSAKEDFRMKLAEAKPYRGLGLLGGGRLRDRA
jgi:hypothetical protein